jgi:hypothetical protein
MSLFLPLKNLERILPHHSNANRLLLVERPACMEGVLPAKTEPDQRKKSGGYPVTAYPPGKVTWVK